MLAPRALRKALSEIPDGSKYKPEYVSQKIEEQPTGDNDGLKNFGLMALSLLLLF